MSNISLAELKKRYWPSRKASPAPSSLWAIRKDLEGSLSDFMAGRAENGVIIHKGTADYIGTHEICDRYLVVDAAIWIEVDDAGNPIGSRIADPFGRVHLEQACPTHRSRLR